MIAKQMALPRGLPQSLFSKAFSQSGTGDFWHAFLGFTPKLSHRFSARREGR
jgi:hypothetical protein